ncbi:MAG TPA: YbhB/YbcL family Raf kinase inhibitor-like protein [Candidatus Sulfotelmatobacter sp.]|nr:YbhB/YbcL family Raf kinase inhibitor-like protein [Candidatus Sulfotelmatobacter sp.]
MCFALGACGSTTSSSTPTPSSPGSSVSAPAAPAATGGTAGTISVSSPQLSSGSFPRQFTCDGANEEPQINWGPLPPETRAVAVEIIDPDAPNGRFIHLTAVVDPAAGARSLSGGSNLHLGRNGAGRDGYIGPCPPSGTHHYHIMVTAVARPLVSSDGGSLDDHFTDQELQPAIRGAGVRATGELVATYAR